MHIEGLSSLTCHPTNIIILSMQVYVRSDMHCSSFKGRKRTSANYQQGQRKKAKLESESLICGVMDAGKYIYHALIILPKLSLSIASLLSSYTYMY